MSKVYFYRMLCLYLSIVGALNWGLVGIANFNLVSHLLGVDSLATRFVYILVGLSGVFFSITYYHAKDNLCKPGSQR